MRGKHLGIGAAALIVASSFIGGAAAVGGGGDAQSGSSSDASGVSDLIMTPEEQQAVPEKIREANQQALTQLATDLDVETVTDNGFAGMVNNAASNTSVIWWRGDVPAEDAEIIAKAEATVRVEVRPAKYSAFELSQVADKNAEQLSKYAVSLRQDGAGLIVTVTDEAQSADAEALSQQLGVPVFVAVGESFTDSGGTRQTDSAPHTGGSGMVQHALPNNSYCSLGYAVLFGSTGKFLSAAHCGDVRWDTPNGNLLANASDIIINSLRDTMELDPSGGTQGRIYMSGYASDFTRKVAQGVQTAVGDEIFTSGANSGAHRSIIVTDTNVRPSGCSDNECAYHIAANSPGEISTIFGDSGGPVGSVRNDDRVDARGIISGGRTAVTCPAASDRAFNPQGECWREVSFFPIGRLVSFWGVQLETMN